MIIDKTAIYSIKEASEVTGVNPRTLTRLAVKLNKEKDNGRYLLEGFELIDYLETKKVNVVDKDALLDENRHLKDKITELSINVSHLSNEVNKLSDSNDVLRLQIDSLETQQDLELEALRSENESLKNELYSKDSNKIIKLIQEIDNDDYVILLLNAIKDEKHLEAMTDEEYSMFVDKLKEANSLAVRVEEYKKEIERMEGYVLDYRNNIEYFKKSLDKRQEETEILLNTIHQRNYIEAKEKGFDDDGELL